MQGYAIQTRVAVFQIEERSLTLVEPSTVLIKNIH